MTDTTVIAALVERLRDMDRVHVGIRNEAAALIERQAAELEQCRKDAERYRWLRKHYHPGTDILDAMRFGRLDSAIDAAIDSAQAAGDMP